MSTVHMNDGKPRDNPNLEYSFSANRVSAIHVALYSMSGFTVSRTVLLYADESDTLR